jgi:hypothetical protein
MIVVFISTKIPIWLGEDWGIFHARELKRYGFWSFNARIPHRLGDAHGRRQMVARCGTGKETR